MVDTSTDSSSNDNNDSSSSYDDDPVPWNILNTTPDPPAVTYTSSDPSDDSPIATLKAPDPAGTNTSRVSLDASDDSPVAVGPLGLGGPVMEQPEGVENIINVATGQFRDIDETNDAIVENLEKASQTEREVNADIALIGTAIIGVVVVGMALAPAVGALSFGAGVMTALTLAAANFDTLMTGLNLTVSALDDLGVPGFHDLAGVLGLSTQGQFNPALGW